MLEPLIIRMTPEKQASKNEKLIDIRKNIYRKVLIASEKNELPLDSPIKYEFADWTLSDILGFENNIIEELKHMRAQKRPLSERVETINKRLKD